MEATPLFYRNNFFDVAFNESGASLHIGYELLDEKSGLPLQSHHWSTTPSRAGASGKKLSWCRKASLQLIPVWAATPMLRIVDDSGEYDAVFDPRYTKYDAWVEKREDDYRQTVVDAFKDWLEITRLMTKEPPPHIKQIELVFPEGRPDKADDAVWGDRTLMWQMHRAAPKWLLGAESNDWDLWYERDPTPVITRDSESFGK